MASIREVQSDYFRIPLPVPLSDSTHGLIPNFELVTIRVRDADGAEGVGYTYTVGRNGRAVQASALEIAELARGHDADLVESLWQSVWWALHYGGRGGPTVLAQSAFDMALWDLKAKRAKLPLWRLLGGFDSKVPVYAGGVDLDFPLEQLLKQAESFLSKGYRAIKMKVGRKHLSEDVQRVAAMRELLGDGFPLMADANMKWSVDQAIRAARALTPFNLVWLEEPIIPDDVAGHARIAIEGGLPIATGENMRTIWEFKQMIAEGKISFPEPDVTNCGGVTPFMKIAHLAEAHNLPVTSHGAHDVTVHLLAAAPNRTYLEAHGFGIEHYIAEPLKINEGFAIAPERHGHGIEFDWQKLGALTT
ncbi:mandelate racemase/muconate lactonizing enzyme family protein [Caballeronia sp. LZ025]|uniref:mandelate racemase/muconate lactonizing enzyme family protein n=1 Tax=Caballeronia TaxID=1827195 RepID=UPI001FD0B653|nr:MULTISPECIES: mandelate racemase/muconate lactonizing enzyme family protein [Caballeronia]MDR5733999.1 mandelate racemase/muconate lactonizing enzyme family protein [Caballeronia sp. LZ025]